MVKLIPNYTLMGMMMRPFFGFLVTFEERHTFWWFYLKPSTDCYSEILFRSSFFKRNTLHLLFPGIRASWYERSV